MKINQLAKISELEGNKEFEEMVDKAKTPEEIVSFLNRQGIEITVDELLEKPELDAELDDNELEKVAGGVQITVFGHSFNLGFIGGYTDSMQTDKCRAPSDENTTNGLFYQLGYKVAGWINGNCW